MLFEWDPNKALANRQKHSVTFEEAETVFYDACALVIADPDHSQQENRFIIIGLSRSLRALVVSHCHRRDDVVRIISARKANRNESNDYWSVR